MKIIVVSDSHGALMSLKQVADKHPEADLFIHLGDGEREMRSLLLLRPELEEKLHYLKGNCDSGTVVDQTFRQETIALPYGHRIFAAHGDRYQVKFGTARMLYEARQQQADILLYGHTHVRECRYEDGVYIINPGSLYYPRDGKKPGYVVISVSEKGILANPMDL